MHIPTLLFLTVVALCFAWLAAKYALAEMQQEAAWGRWSLALVITAVSLINAYIVAFGWVRLLS